MRIAIFKGNKGKWETLEISTIKCELLAFGLQPYETAVSWPRKYFQSEGDWTVVEAYDTEELARAGHDRWVQIMLKTPPDKLVDCCNFSLMADRKERGLLALEDLVTEKREGE